MEVKFDVPDGHVLGAVVIGKDAWTVSADGSIPGVEKLLRQALLQAAFPEVEEERLARTQRLLEGAHPLRKPYTRRKTA